MTRTWLKLKTARRRGLIFLELGATVFFLLVSVLSKFNFQADDRGNARKSFFVRVDPKTGKVSQPVSPATKGKHPVAVGNARGEVLLAWTEGTGWGKGGAVA